MPSREAIDPTADPVGPGGGHAAKAREEGSSPRGCPGDRVGHVDGGSRDAARGRGLLRERSHGRRHAEGGRRRARPRREAIEAPAEEAESPADAIEPALEASVPGGRQAEEAALEERDLLVL